MTKSKKERRAKRKKMIKHVCKVIGCTMTGAKIGCLVAAPLCGPAGAATFAPIGAMAGFALGVRSVLKDDLIGDVGPTAYDVCTDCIKEMLD
ncbi:hypothetical protein BDA96_04G057600 [Sorghum bicolor]|uniref:Uncharacterized protein n=2 Tax=Sorghum bicolor TaxID=4558 RepID=A0A921UJ93_SORBI|nr:hypothetical protein BDA96_04G057600 [Sorghum bicolor]KAG0531851.1 hypothetical protein BDA96_04G057600 [Sorghum bicolor]KXG29544.1 hypothetical protein SORBI_3004G052500 [Sorghum bicolor]KXG29545.1 hypothetical protein SORBI_3004G052500 [Sorghum bicolor]